MHPEQIKAHIRMRGTTASAIASSMSRSRMAVSNVIHGRIKSRPIAQQIAEVLSLSLEELWPGRYPDPKRKPRARRRKS